MLSEEELGNKLHVHALTQEYVARVNNPRAYDAISRDIMQRWCFPFVPDTNLLAPTQGLSSYSYQRHYRYRCNLDQVFSRAVPAYSIAMTPDIPSLSHIATSTFLSFHGLFRLMPSARVRNRFLRNCLESELLYLQCRSQGCISRCREQGVVVARDAVLEHDTAIGAGTHIDESAVVRVSSFKH